MMKKMQSYRILSQVKPTLTQIKKVAATSINYFDRTAAIHRNLVVFLVLILSFSSCIKRFTPSISENAANKYVVQGMVGSIEGWQMVYVSRTSSIDLALYIPVNNCEISILDDEGNSFSLDQFDEGSYRVWMDESDLVAGRSYKVIIDTPTGDIIESDFDTMYEGPEEMGDVYYELADVQTDDPEVLLRGIQFYTDFSASEEDAIYYRWKCTQTFEYKALYPLEFYYDGIVHQVSPPDWSKNVCYKTEVVEGIFTLSTINLTTKEYPGFPLNFVQNTSNRLAIMYSLMVEQSSISLAAFNYYDKLRINLEQSGGLYTSQPLAVKGNLINTSNEENEVLGFFQASSVAYKRIFVEAPVPGLTLDYEENCSINPLWLGLFEIPPREYPAFLYTVDGQWSPITMSPNCVDCRYSGGVLMKPDYWPN